MVNELDSGLGRLGLNTGWSVSVMFLGPKSETGYSWITEVQVTFLKLMEEHRMNCSVHRIHPGDERYF